MAARGAASLWCRGPGGVRSWWQRALATGEVGERGEKIERARRCFRFKVSNDPQQLAQYKEHHRNVWPEMQAALQRQGWHQYSLFLDERDGTLIGVFESERNLAECVAGMETEPINATWQQHMQKYFPASEQRPDEQMVELEEIMFLDI